MKPYGGKVPWCRIERLTGHDMAIKRANKRSERHRAAREIQRELVHREDQPREREPPSPT